MESLCLSPSLRLQLADAAELFRLTLKKFKGSTGSATSVSVQNTSMGLDLEIGETRRRLGGFAPELTLALWGDRADVIVGFDFKLRYLNRRRRGDSGN